MILEDTVDVGKSNAVYYSFVESAKSNNLNIYEYLNYLLKEFTQLNEEQVEKYLTWSKNLLDYVKNYDGEYK